MSTRTKPHFAIQPQPTERLLSELVLAAARETDPTRFFATYLSHAVQLSAARHAIVWLVNSTGGLEPLAHVNRGDSWSTAELAAAAQLASAWAQRWQGFAPTFVEVRDDLGQTARLPLVGPRLIVPLRREHEIRGFLELLLAEQPTELAQAQLTDHALVLAAAGEQFLLRHHRPQATTGPLVSRSLGELLQLIHAQLDLSATCYAVANETRRHLAADRVSVLLPRPARPRVMAISGKEQFDPRSAVVRAMEHVCQQAGLGTEPLWLNEPGLDEPGRYLSPELRQAEQELHQVSPARLAVIWPLVIPPAPVPTAAHDARDDLCGWLIIEHFDATADRIAWRARLAELAPHVTLALRNAAEHDDLPLRAWGETIRSVWGRRQIARSTLIGALLASIVAALFLIPTELRIDARGELQPVERQHVFAPADGIVQEVLVTHGQLVAANDTLAVLRRPELEFELTRVQGELQTAEKRLSTLAASRLRDKSHTFTPAAEQQQLSADEAEWKQAVVGLRRQQDELLRQQESLTIRARQPGRVLTWDVQPALVARPVQRGQVLLTLGRHDGPWQLELDVREDRVGYIAAAQASAPSALSIEYRLASEPAQRYVTHLTRLAERSEFKTPSQPTVRATAPVANVAREHLRPGTAVVAQVHCGQVSLAQSWFLDLVHYLRTHWWL